MVPARHALGARLACRLVSPLHCCPAKHEDCSKREILAMTMTGGLHLTPGSSSTREETAAQVVSPAISVLARTLLGSLSQGLLRLIGLRRTWH